MKKPGLFTWIVVGFALGIIVGAIVGEPMVALKPFGDLFIRLLKMLVVPLVFATLVVGVASISPGKLARMGWKTLVFYYATGIIACGISIISFSIDETG